MLVELYVEALMLIETRMTGEDAMEGLAEAVRVTIEAAREESVEIVRYCL